MSLEASRGSCGGVGDGEFDLSPLRFLGEYGHFFIGVIYLWKVVVPFRDLWEATL